MSSRPSKTDIQLAIFEESLERLLKGEGKYVGTGTKLSIAQLAKESGVGSGTLYYRPYAEFRIRASKLMAQYNAGEGGEKLVSVSHTGDLKSLRDDRNNEKRLKEKYRETCEELKVKIKKLCAERCAVEHALYTTTVRIAELELKFEQVTGKRPDDYFFENDEKVAFLPRNLQLIK